VPVSSIGRRLLGGRWAEVLREAYDGSLPRVFDDAFAIPIQSARPASKTCCKRPPTGGCSFDLVDLLIRA